VIGRFELGPFRDGPFCMCTVATEYVDNNIYHLYIEITFISRPNQVGGRTVDTCLFLVADKIFSCSR
jgi:hypothetical protein